MADQYEIIRDILLQHTKRISKNYEWPWLDEIPLSMRNANKFLLGAILNYRMPADVVWRNARRLAEEILGDPPRLWNHIVESYNKEEWDSKCLEFNLPYNLHIFQAARRRIWRIGSDIVRLYDGDSRKIWQGKTPGDALIALEGLRCGPAISRMIVGALITCNHLTGRSDVKPDAHVKRVLRMVFGKQLDSSTAIQLCRKIHPDNPWELDLALYDIGKTYCHPSSPYCEDCPISRICAAAQ